MRGRTGYLCARRRGTLDGGRISMSFGDIAYAVACVVLPVAWGLVVVWLSGRVEARVARHAGARRGARRRRVRPIEYHI